MRVGVPIEDRVLAPSTVLKKLAALPKTNVVCALREIGRIERTLFMIEWYSRPELRDCCRVGLNKGEAGHKLARAVFIHERPRRLLREPGFPRLRPLRTKLVSSMFYNVVQLRTALVVTPTPMRFEFAREGPRYSFNARLRGLVDNQVRQTEMPGDRSEVDHGKAEVDRLLELWRSNRERALKLETQALSRQAQRRAR